MDDGYCRVVKRGSSRLHTHTEQMVWLQSLFNIQMDQVSFVIGITTGDNARISHNARCPKKLCRILKLSFGAENTYALKMFIFPYSRNLYNLLSTFQPFMP